MVYPMDSSKKIGNFSEVFDFDRLFLKLNA
jgi:hypothetical protein